MLKSLILAHRGLWNQAEDQNSSGALVAALQEGFGLETDIRDHCGHLVVSHDPPSGGEIMLREVLPFLELLEKMPFLAFNIKSDGLLPLISEEISPKVLDASFFFDMSRPEQWRFDESCLPTAMRLSEYEPSLRNFHTKNRFSRKIWLDAFHSEWWVDVDPEALAPDGWTTFVVSPELHGRDPGLAWERLNSDDWKDRQVGICTDFPLEFLEFIEGHVE